MKLLWYACIVFMGCAYVMLINNIRDREIPTKIRVVELGLAVLLIPMFITSVYTVRQSAVVGALCLFAGGALGTYIMNRIEK